MVTPWDITHILKIQSAWNFDGIFYFPNKIA